MRYPNCNEHGVLGILPGIVGNLQALETIKVITGIGEVLSGSLLLYDGLAQRIQKMKFDAKPESKDITALADSYDFSCETPIKSVPAIGVPKLLEDGSITLVDVRTKIEFERNHLNGVNHIPLDEIEEKAHEIDRELPVYVICQSGIRSQKAVLILQELFPENEFVNVEGGMNQINTYANTY